MPRNEELDELINSIMNDRPTIRTYKKYFIIMNDYDTFILKIYDDADRPNDMNNDDLITQYMRNNYYGHSYEAIEINSTDYSVIEIE